jgi:hypothetical protein
MSAKGMQINIFAVPQNNLTHAELIIFFNNRLNPAIPYLTFENMFNRDIHDSDTNLLSAFRRLGNDFQIEKRVDFLKISVNFLSDRISQFTHLLDELFSYKSFSLKRFNKSIYNYWKYFKAKNDWEKMLAQQYAYAHLFPDNFMGNTVINPDSLAKINLAQIRSFYRNTFRLEKSVLFVKGGINPHITFGLIEKTLKSYKNQNRVKPSCEKYSMKSNRKLIILDILSNETPQIIWYLAVPPLGDPDHMLWVIANNILYDYPFGELFKKASFFGIRNIKKIDSEIENYGQVSVICNTIKINYPDIERFILMTDNEVRKLGKRKIDRKEYLDSLNYFLGKSKVDTMDFDYDIHQDINKTILNLERRPLSISPKIFQQITLNDLNLFVGNFGRLSRDNNNVEKPEIIVIAGNARLIKGYLNILKPDFIYSGY